MLSFAARATGGMIHTYDKEKDTEYCEILYQYLNCSLSKKRPAMSFFTKCNTVLYRLFYIFPYRHEWKTLGNKMGNIYNLECVFNNDLNYKLLLHDVDFI